MFKNIYQMLLEFVLTLIKKHKAYFANNTFNLYNIKLIRLVWSSRFSKYFMACTKHFLFFFIFLYKQITSILLISPSELESWIS